MTDKKDIGHVDAVLQKLGPFKTYTIVQFSMHILAQFAVATHMLSIVFTGQQNPFRCTLPSSVNGSHQDPLHANFYVAANSSAVNASQQDFDSVCHTSPQNPGHDSPPNSVLTCTANDVEFQMQRNLYFVSEFGLVCDREFFAGLTQTLLTLGHAIGSLSFPYFADNYGRRPILLLCSILWLGSALGVAFSVNYTMLAICKTLVGIFLQGVSQTSVTTMMEILTGRQRGHMFGSLAFIFWTMSIILMVPIAYALREYSWRYLELAYCSYFIYILLYLLFLDESLRWLAANGLKDRVLDVLKKASRWNSSNFDDVVFAFYKGSEIETTKQEKAVIFQTLDVKQQTTNSEEKLKEQILPIDETKTVNDQLDGEIVSPKKLNCLSLFKEKMLRNSTLFSMLSWFFNSLTYYALFLMSSSLSGSLYLNYFLNSVVEIPSAILLYFFIDRLGRKICFASFSVIAGISLVAAAALSALLYEQKISIKVLTILGKFGISGSFGTIYTMTPELFPTNVRTTALGLANMSACLGGMLAPFAGLLMSKAVYAPGLIFGISSLVLSAWAYFLPETARRQLPQSVADIEGWLQERKNKEKCGKTSDVAETNYHDNHAFAEYNV